MAEPLERDAVLAGYTYKLRWAGSDHAIYVTINDIEREGRRRPFEVFINTKNLEHYAWTVALTRMISAVFRRGGDKPGLYRVNADGSGLAILVEGSAADALILSDDRTVLYLSNRSGPQTLWSVPLSGGPPREILHRTLYSGNGALSESPDGQRLKLLGGPVDGRPAVLVCDLPDCTNPRDFAGPQVARRLQSRHGVPSSPALLPGGEGSPASSLPLPLGEGWGEGARSMRSMPPIKSINSPRRCLSNPGRA